MDGPTNNFVSPFNAHNNITAVMAQAAVLGNVSAGGNLIVTSTDGNTAAAGSTITVDGTTINDAAQQHHIDGPTNNCRSVQRPRQQHHRGGWRRRAGAGQCQRRRQSGCDQH
ncbi:MAG: hemagglutinin repeat-containing protein [Rhodocyclaceae bacterium]|nr:hemagglutinin repeat-containing protein [Rhodocyclaceae bacterium]